MSANGTFTSNGVKSHENGKEAYKGVKGTVPLKAVATKPSAEQSSRKTPSTISKVEKVPSNPRLKFSISGSSGCKGVPPTSNGKVNVHKSQSVKMNGVVKDSVPKEKSGKDPFINTNGSYKSKRVDLVGRGNDLASVSTSENGDTQSVGLNPVKPDPHEGNCTSSWTTAGRVPDPAKLLNGSVKFDTDISGSKRKSQESCILLAQDSESLAKLQELEEVYVLSLKLFCTFLVNVNLYCLHFFLLSLILHFVFSWLISVHVILCFQFSQSHAYHLLRCDSYQLGLRIG